MSGIEGYLVRIIVKHVLVQLQGITLNDLESNARCCYSGVVDWLSTLARVGVANHLITSNISSQPSEDCAFDT